MIKINFKKIFSILIRIIYLILISIAVSYITIGIFFKEEFINGPIIFGHYLLFILTFPLGIISYLYEPLIKYFAIFLEYIGVFSYMKHSDKLIEIVTLNITYITISILGYYQWFIWFPDYLVRKKIKKLIKNGYTDKEIIEKLNLEEHNKEDIKELRKWVKGKNGDK